MKSIKYVFKGVLSLCILLLSLSSCEKKDKTEAYLIGSWNLAQMHVISKENGIKISEDVHFPVDSQIVWTFNEDGSCFQMNVSGGDTEMEAGFWQYLNDYLVVTFDGGEDYMNWKVVSIDKKQLVLMYSESGLTGDYDDDIRVPWEDILTYTFTRMK